MADNKTKSGTADRTRINVDQPYERRYWKRHFKVSERALIEAVNAVGPSVRKVQAYLHEAADGKPAARKKKG